MPVLRSLANVGQDPKMAMRLVQALIESTATPQTNTLPAPAQDKLMNGEDLAQATARAMSTGTVSQNRMPPPAAPPMAAELMSPEEFGSRTGTITGGDTRNMLRGEMPLTPGDLRAIPKAIAGLKKPWNMLKDEYLKANPHDPGTGIDSWSRGNVFDALPDESEVWVFHATDSSTANAMLRDGVDAANKPWNLSREQFEQGLRGGSAGRFAPGKGLGEGLYVGSSPVGIEGYGKRILAVRTTKGSVAVSPEAGFLNKTPGLALSDSDAMLRGAISPDDILDVTPTTNQGRYVYGYEGLMNAAKDRGLVP